MKNKTLTGYCIGFLISLILTAAVFYLVAHPGLVPQGSMPKWIVGLGVLQIIAQVAFFLRLNHITADRTWNWISLVFTVIVMIIIVSGSLWIMYNLNYYMVN